MTINLICFGKLRVADQVLFDMYHKKLHNCKFNLIELKESNNKNIELKVNAETKMVLEKIPKNSMVYFLDLRGDKMDSVDFANKLQVANITFVIGGSNGFDQELIKSFAKISFSDMTFPHELFRIMLMEQIYRGIKINENSNYHK
ncbi:Ribosomal RNA large subunit methyltransferase H [Mycoplasmopsis californica]|uniref:Ribosomal RNA large subunit methyltransferase H n=1 Tax=Mycoplasmopsis equigenitalium TaxID=114883 RepID=A0ABY5J1K6_9BACT|nr:23S rRNA (pseudouridine(1915)-N(3))-methyltransferase RlmH [Mycoplasmopsis equigenitalium]UUD37124.1 23S rRNA (pseudouridine(1915)-N(3))-methyltransferase RlmH [Mycoplasmopsis equigenitalium]VEU69570.1 Ribosomal RNA large subunit methyltransferase H [Mycoplasmopsis californica]